MAGPYDMTHLGRIYEDMGSLKALMASVDRKLDEGNDEFKSLRTEQADLRQRLTELKSNGDARSDTIKDLYDEVKTLNERVDKLVALRHRLGGAFVVITAVSGFVYGAWSVIVKVVALVSTLPK